VNARGATALEEGLVSIARRLKWYIESHGVEYETRAHPHSSSSLETARKARVSPEQLAKCVLLEDERGYVLAILPSSRRVDLRALSRQLGRRLELASEGELAVLFADCETGAVPAMGPAYGIPVLIDDSLEASPDLYFESGDHEELIHMQQRDFMQLLSGARRAHFGQLRH
jgi:Ala-tRNA(Pro) deacylase